MKNVPLSFVAILVGVVLIVGSVLWPRFFPTEWGWDQDQARQYRQAGLELHGLSHQHGDGHENHDHDHEEENAELVAARERYEQMTTELENARSWRNTPAAWMKWAGVSIALVGVLIHMAGRGRTVA